MISTSKGLLIIMLLEKAKRHQALHSSMALATPFSQDNHPTLPCYWETEL
jgi:hypothetical protein